MKIEKRGKYPGVKVHLDAGEVEAVLEAYHKTLTIPAPSMAVLLIRTLGKEIEKEKQKHPDLLAERTPEQIREELELELRKSQEKLAAMDAGQDWKKISLT